jgi:hypothetical protein
MGWFDFQWPWEEAGDNLAENLDKVVASLGKMFALLLLMIVGILMMLGKINFLPRFWNGIVGLIITVAIALFLAGLI